MEELNSKFPELRVVEKDFNLKTAADEIISAFIYMNHTLVMKMKNMVSLFPTLRAKLNVTAKCPAGSEIISPYDNDNLCGMLYLLGQMHDKDSFLNFYDWLIQFDSKNFKNESLSCILL